MKHYEIRSGISSQTVRIELNERHRFNMQPGATLWQVERESEAEAAVRRWNALWHNFEGKEAHLYIAPRDVLLAELDSTCPPPAPKETQLDWNTGEPIEAIYCWQLPSGLFTASNICESAFKERKSDVNYLSILEGATSIGPTRDAAIANLRAIRASLKPQTK